MAKRAAESPGIDKRWIARKMKAGFSQKRWRMPRPHIVWALVGMVGYSFTTLFVKLAVRSGKVSSFMVLAVATGMVAISAVTLVFIRGEIHLYGGQLRTWSTLWIVSTGISLTIAVTSLFRALSLGPASVVVPLYGMFIVGGSMLSVLFIDEPLSARKIAGLVAAVIGAYLVSS